MSPCGRLCLLVFVGLILPIRGKAQPLTPPCCRAPSPASSACVAGWAAGEFGCSVLCPQSPLELAPGSGGPNKGAKVTPCLDTSDLGGCFQRVWPGPVLLGILCFTSKKDSRSLIWQGDGCQFPTWQPGTLDSQQSSSLGSPGDI